MLALLLPAHPHDCTCNRQPVLRLWPCGRLYVGIVVHADRQGRAGMNGGCVVGWLGRGGGL
eukprot:6903213-Prymnesium_polylepis.1